MSAKRAHRDGGGAHPLRDHGRGNRSAVVAALAPANALPEVHMPTGRQDTEYEASGLRRPHTRRAADVAQPQYPTQ